MNQSKHDHSLGNLTLLVLFFLCLSVILWRAWFELPYRDELLRERFVWRCLFSISYSALLIVSAKLVSVGAGRLTFLKIRYLVFGAISGAVPALLLWYFLTEVKGPSGCLGALLMSVFELSTLPGKSLLALAGRSSDLWSDHFPLGYEQEQLLLFLPLNVIGWFTLTEGVGLLWRKILNRMTRFEIFISLGILIAACCGLLSFFGSWDLPFTVGLVLTLPETVVATLTLGLSEVKGPGILPASIYFSVSVLLLLLVLRRRLAKKTSRCTRRPKNRQRK